MSNPFRTIDELIDRRWVVPLAKPVSIQDDWKPGTADHGTVALWELLAVIRNEFSKINAQNKGMRKALELYPQWCAETLFASNPEKQKYFNWLFERYEVRTPPAYIAHATYEVAPNPPTSGDERG